MPGGLFVRSFGGRARIYKIFGNPAIHQQYPLTRHSLAIERRALLQRMVNVVADADTLSKELFAHAFVQAGALVF